MKFYRNSIIVLLIFAGLVLFSCASTKKVSESGDVTQIALSEEELNQNQNAVQEKQAELFNLDWTKKSSKNVDATYGIVRLQAIKNLGTFNIGFVNDSKKTIPVLSTSNEYISTSLYLKAGKKIIKLNQNSSVKTYSQKTAKGMQIAYLIDGVADVVIDFDSFSTNVRPNVVDSVKITAAVRNRGKKKEDFALKFVLDTVLGETDRHHFYDSNGEPIKTEKEYKELRNSDWFVSQNINGAMIFTFTGLDATPPELVALANYSTIDTTSWLPKMSSYRSFDNVLSYNNSAVGVVWNSQKLSQNEYFGNVFYITVGKNSGKITKNPASGSEGTSAGVEEVPAEKTVEIKKQEPLTKNDKYTADYIQSILDRIDALKEDGTENKSEIEALNKELDLIFEAMVN